MTKLEELYKIFTKSAGIYTDTRKPLSKGVFFALRGIFYDGNKYASKALNQGAYRVIVDDFSLSNKSEKFIYVKNTYETLKKLANYHRKKLSRFLCFSKVRQIRNERFKYCRTGF